ncbi:MAG: hypothetical protein M9910_08745 [Kiritimatiellae bacterium]|nr:hypothetical protein [Kiritimatiellia bacterium]
MWFRRAIQTGDESFLLTCSASISIGWPSHSAAKAYTALILAGWLMALPARSGEWMRDAVGGERLVARLFR